LEKDLKKNRGKRIMNDKMLICVEALKTFVKESDTEDEEFYQTGLDAISRYLMEPDTVMLRSMMDLIDKEVEKLHQSEDYKQARLAWQNRQESHPREIVTGGIANESGYYMGLEAGMKLALNAIVKSLIKE
jgi:hypothetical protein